MREKAALRDRANEERIRQITLRHYSRMRLIGIVVAALGVTSAIGMTFLAVTHSPFLDTLNGTIVTPSYERWKGSGTATGTIVAYTVGSLGVGLWLTVRASRRLRVERKLAAQQSN